MRQALRKLEKSYNDKSKELFETINIGIDNWTPPPIQQEFVECVNIPKNVGAKNLLPEPDGKTAATESKAERDAEWVYDDKKKKDKNLTIKEVDKHLHFVHKIFIHKMPNGEIDYQDMRMPGIVGEYAFDDMSWSERTTSEFKAFKEIIARKNYGMPEIYSHIKDETVGMLFDVFCELFEDDVFEKFHISEKRLKLYRQQLDSIFCGFWYDWYAMRERN
jgi:hypothetical protein